MTPKPNEDDETVHDVLAAEEFPVGVGDPALNEEPHDVLAAEEFPLGYRDPQLHEEPVHDVLAAEEFPVGDADPQLEEREEQAAEHAHHHHHDHDHDHDHHDHDHDEEGVIYIDLPVVGAVVAALAAAFLVGRRVLRHRRAS